ncbi:MAG TPA: hypothetical protein VHP33_21490 [Polyangiaceae bacterium]|nr:hypothetical protein [Polyangiaceae bacterium]
MTSPSAFIERLLGWRSGASLLGFALALLPRSAAAQTPPIELTWQAPPDCPSKEAVLSRARSLLGTKATKVDKVRAEGTIRKRDERYELTLLINENGQIGERRVWARQCEELSGAAAISLVLLLTSGHDNTASSSDVTGTGGYAGTPSTPSTAPQSDPTPPATTPAPPSDAPRPSDGHRSWHLLASAPLLAFGVGPLPKPSLGLGAGIGLQGRAWSVRLVGQWYTSQTLPAPVQPYGADVKRIAAGLWGCWDLQRSGWSFSPCLRGTLTHLSATGYGPYLLPATQTQTWFGVGVGAIGRLQAMENLALTVGAGVQVELSRPVILVKTLGTVQQLAPLSAIVQLGPEWIF